MKHQTLKNLLLAAMFMAVGIILPFLTGQIPQIGGMLLPMHIPVLFCGLICGWQYGATVGFILPLLRFMLFGMPPIFPTGVAMTAELAVYGLVIGLVYAHSRWKCVYSLYRALITAMVCGRIAWGVVRVLLSGVAGEAFTWQLFMAGAFFNAIPGIIVQLVLIPAIMVALGKTGLILFSRKPDALPEH